MHLSHSTDFMGSTLWLMLPNTIHIYSLRYGNIDASVQATSLDSSIPGLFLRVKLLHFITAEFRSVIVVMHVYRFSDPKLRLDFGIPLHFVTPVAWVRNMAAAHYW